MYTATVNASTANQVSFKDRTNMVGEVDGEAFELDLVEVKPNQWHLVIDGHSHQVDLLEHNKDEKTVTLLVDGHTCTVSIKDRYDALLEKLGMDSLSGNAVKELKAPMPGLVLDIHVKAGETVKKGDTLLILEAMKMENVLKAPGDGTVANIPIEQGLAVEKNQVLIHFE